MSTTSRRAATLLLLSAFDVLDGYTDAMIACAVSSCPNFAPSETRE